MGLDGSLTAARRLACLAGVQQSFAQAEALLRELARWELDGETIRRLCHAEAARAAAARERRAAAAAFAAAPGDRELQIDAGEVNTRGGWRDVKAAVFACRGRGAPAEASARDKRDLPAPAARSAVAAVEEASAFGAARRGRGGWV